MRQALQALSQVLDGAVARRTDNAPVVAAFVRRLRSIE
jgi:hypothetical protein